MGRIRGRATSAEREPRRVHFYLGWVPVGHGDTDHMHYRRGVVLLGPASARYRRAAQIRLRSRHQRVTAREHHRGPYTVESTLRHHAQSTRTRANVVCRLYDLPITACGPTWRPSRDRLATVSHHNPAHVRDRLHEHDAQTDSVNAIKPQKIDFRNPRPRATRKKITSRLALQALESESSCRDSSS